MNKPEKFILASLAAGIIFSASLIFAQSTPDTSNVVTGYVQQNLIIPVNNLSNATIVIDNRQVVIDGIWNFKGPDGRVLDEAEIISQPRNITDKLILAARAVGETTVSVTENNSTTVYTVQVIPRNPPPRERSAASTTIEQTLQRLMGLSGVKVTVLDSASEFLSEGAVSDPDSATQPNTSTATTTTTATTANSANIQNSLPTFQPTIILEGEVEDDLDKRRALSLARAFSNNVLDFIQVANPLQVRIKIQVVAVTLDDDHEIGVEYEGSNDSVQGYSTEFGIDTVARKIIDLHYPFFHVARSGGGFDISAMVNLVKNISSIRVLQEPTITVLNGQSGYFRVGGQFPVNRRTIDSSGAIIITTEYRPFGISLLVTPLAALPNFVPGNTHHIGDDDLILGVPENGIPLENQNTGLSNTISPSIDKNGIIKLYVRPSISSLDFTRVDQDPDNHPDPLINERLVETRVAMKDGESLVIGGLFDEDFRESMQSVPFIEKVPILGELFKNRVKSKERTELVFILTPNVVGRKKIMEGDVEPRRLSEMSDYMKDYKIPTVQAKPTRITATDVAPRPFIKPYVSPAVSPPLSVEEPSEEPQPDVQTTPTVEETTAMVEPVEPVEPATEEAATEVVEEVPAEAVEVVEETTQTTEAAEENTEEIEAGAEFIPVNSFTPVDTASVEEPEKPVEEIQPTSDEEESSMEETITEIPVEETETIEEAAEETTEAVESIEEQVAEEVEQQEEVSTEETETPAVTEEEVTETENETAEEVSSETIEETNAVEETAEAEQQEEEIEEAAVEEGTPVAAEDQTFMEPQNISISLPSPDASIEGGQFIPVPEVSNSSEEEISTEEAPEETSQSEAVPQSVN